MTDRLADLRTRLQSYLDAEQRILQSQEYTIGNGGTARRNRRADLEQVRAGIADCEQQIAQLTALRDTIAELRHDAAQPDPDSCSADQVCRYL